MKLCPSGQCTACAACYNACTTRSICMVEDELGELKPHIDDGKCVDCGKCTSVCPIMNPTPKNRPQKCYALYTRNEEDRKTCSSGGVATTLARRIIRIGGVVYGAVYNEKGILVLKKACIPEELEAFKGSKYTYAFPGLIYRDVEHELKMGATCLFVGTPCQVDGLKHYTGKDDDHLLTVSLICHATQPFTYLQQYIRSIVGAKKASGAHATFRGKRDFMFTIISKKGKILYTRKSGEDPYFHAFLKELIHREICYACPYAQEQRVSDITIGDFWGLDKKALGGYKGRVSVALLNTEKGIRFFNEVLPEFVAEERTVEEAVKGNMHLRRPAQKHLQREAFIKAYKEKGFVYALAQTDIPRQTRRNYVRNRILWLPRKIKRLLKSKR